MAMIDFQVTGIRGLDRQLALMPKTMRDKAMRSATRQVAKFTQRQALREVPEDTGQLAASLKVRAAKRGRNKNFVAHNVETKDGMFRGDEFYGAMVEFGTKRRWTREGWYRGFVERNRFAFLRPALFLNVARKRRIFISAVNRWIVEQTAISKTAARLLGRR